MADYKPWSVLYDADDIDETARLILMEHRSIRVFDFIKAMREVHPRLELGVLGEIYQRYMGLFATHSFETGEPLNHNRT